MSVSSDSVVVLTRAQVKAIVKQSRAVDENKQRPALQAIVKRGAYAYFTDRFTAVRWDLGELCFATRRVCVFLCFVLWCGIFVVVTRCGVLNS